MKSLTSLDVRWKSNQSVWKFMIKNVQKDQIILFAQEKHDNMNWKFPWK